MRFTKFILYLLCACLISFVLQVEAECEELQFTGKIEAEFGYFSDALLKRYVDRSKARIESEGFRVIEVNRLAQFPLDAGVNITFQFFYDNFGIGVSSGAHTLLNYATIDYNLPIDRRPHAHIQIYSLLLPQVITFYYRFKLKENISMTVGAGPGYYIGYTHISTAYNDSQEKSAYQSIPDHRQIDNMAGIDAILDFAWNFSEKHALTFGVRGDFIFTKDNFIPGVAGYIGFMESIQL